MAFHIRLATVVFFFRNRLGHNFRKHTYTDIQARQPKTQ
jgi:hypothetical protein